MKSTELEVVLIGRGSSVHVGEKGATPRAQSIPEIAVSRQDKWVPSACILLGKPSKRMMSG